jgi:hypothetical protein
MQLLLNILLWVFLWPLKLPFWLWKHETIGKVFATLWLVCLVLIGLNVRPKQAMKIDVPFAKANIAASLPSAATPSLRNAVQLSGELTLTKASLIGAALVNTMPTLASPSTVTYLPTLTPTPAIPTDPPAFTETPLLIPTFTPLPALTSTSTPTSTLTSIPTATASHMQTPNSDSNTITTPTALPPASTSASIIIRPTDTPVAQAGDGNPNAFTCVGGCTEAPDPSCAIKGNVNAKGDRIYHIPGGKNYDRTTIKPAEGDRWFCTEQEAQSADFRAAKNW